LGALFLRLNGVAFGEPVGSLEPSRMSYAPVLLHLAIVFCAGIFIPPIVAGWFQHVAQLLG
jgi:hydrogenase-4 component F